MHLIRAATLIVQDPDASANLYGNWLDYQIAEEGEVSHDLAAAWGASNMAGRRMVTTRPASGRNTYLRFVQGEPVAGYLPLRTYGWNAIEICVQDVLKVSKRMEQSPFEIIGPPRKIEGLDAIHPMQVKGPDQEIVYLTQINADLPEYNLPRAQSPIDSLFILVLGCSDLSTSRDWFRKTLGLTAGREMDIVYTMIARAYGLPESELHTIATMIDEKDVFLEFDQYPSAAISRPVPKGELPPGIAFATLQHRNLDAIKSGWLIPPTRREGPVYTGARSGMLQAPDETLVEIVEVTK